MAQTGVLIDGSKNGLSIWVRKPPPVGTRVDVRIRFQGGRSTRVSGEIASQGVYRIGVKVLNSDPQLEDSLRALRRLNL